jgi:hypothetical protein
VKCGKAKTEGKTVRRGSTNEFTIWETKRVRKGAKWKPGIPPSCHAPASQSRWRGGGEGGRERKHMGEKRGGASPNLNTHDIVLHLQVFFGFRFEIKW